MRATDNLTVVSLASHHLGLNLLLESGKDSQRRTPPPSPRPPPLGRPNPPAQTRNISPPCCTFVCFHMAHTHTHVCIIYIYIDITMMTMYICDTHIIYIHSNIYIHITRCPFVCLVFFFFVFFLLFPIQNVLFLCSRFPQGSRGVSRCSWRGRSISSPPTETRSTYSSRAEAPPPSTLPPLPPSLASLPCLRDSPPTLPLRPTDPPPTPSASPLPYLLPP